MIFGVLFVFFWNPTEGATVWVETPSTPERIVGFLFVFFQSSKKQLIDSNQDSRPREFPHTPLRFF